MEMKKQRKQGVTKIHTRKKLECKGNLPRFNYQG